MEQRIQWGIIGCGDVTEVKSGPALDLIPGSRRVMVMRRDAALAQDYARRHVVPKWTSDADELINDPDVNAVYIATPPDTHSAYTIKAAQAGKPVYVEKPMALDHRQCQAMIAACQAAEVPLFVAYYRRRLPAYLKIKDLIESGAIGQTRLFNINMLRPMRDLDRQIPWRLRPEIAGGGHFVDLASHQLDFMDDCFGPIQEVVGHARNQAQAYPAEDIVSASFVCKSGVVGNGLWCFTAATCCQRDCVEIVGDQGRITFSTFNHEIPVTLTTATGTETFHIPQPKHVQQPLLETVVGELQGSGKCPSTGISGARTTWVMQQILR